MMKLRQCGETWVSQENGHFSFNNGSNSSWIRNSVLEKYVYGNQVLDMHKPFCRDYFHTFMCSCRYQFITNKLKKIFAAIYL
jgi:hypothetical protein